MHAWTRRGMPVAKPGRPGHGGAAEYDLAAVVRWYFATNFERLELDRARTRLAHEQAEAKRMDNAVREGDLAPAHVILQVHAALVREADAKLGRIARKVAPDLEGLTTVERITVIDAAIRECLERLSTYRPRRPRR